ncbi:TPA: transporter substrate-binding domain-containing protein [Vibrio cholerae]|nr:transporter substrate-binding domain-containing protein [Vibrio cholerae]
MKKILLASLIGLVSASAAAQQEIKFVMEATYAPFEYMDENNQIQGFDVDLANALCKQLEAKCSFHNQAFDSLIPALKFKRYDAAISAMDITEARLEQVNFSNPYYDNSAAFVSLAGKVADQAALKGKRVGVQNGSTHQSFLLEQLSDVVAVPYSSYRSSGEHLLAVLNDILDFSRLEQGKFRIQKNEFRLKELVCAIDRIYRPLCNEKGLELVVNSNITTAAIVRSDQIRINQILFNLLNNAIKFTHQGSIRVELQLIEGDPLAQLVIQVVDTGIGIREQDLTVIFEPFMQAESTTTREYGGSGLGLTIVHSLVEMLSGQLHVSSEYGIGTRFEIQLPIELVEKPDAPQQLLPAPEPQPLFDKTLRVLLVEDNHTNAFIAQAFCRKYGLDVSWVTDGLQAIEELKIHDYDLVLMDNQLPYLDGVETTRTIKKVLHLPVVVYACTADGLEETRQAFFHAGAEYVLVKPLKEQTLHKALEHFKHHHGQKNAGLN